MKIISVLFLLGSLYASSERDLMPGADSISSDQVIPEYRENVVKDARLPDQRNTPTLPRLNLNTPAVQEGIEQARSTMQQLLKNASEIIPQDKSDQYTEVDIKKESLDLKTPQRLSNDEDSRVDSVSLKSSALKKTMTKKASVNQSGMIVFKENYKVSIKPEDTELKISLPSGSTALGELMAGVEIDDDGERVDVRLLGAFIGPNNSYVELSNCHVWMNVSSKMNTKRIKGVADEIVCRSKDGTVITSVAMMQLRDSRDEYIGVKGELNLENFEKAAGLQFAEGFVNGFGKAVAAANVTQSVTQASSEFAPEKSTNVTGSKPAYIAGQTISEATGGFLGRISDFYWSLRPTLAVAPGTKVLMTITKTSEIPKKFFKSNKNESGFNTY